MKENNNKTKTGCSENTRQLYNVLMYPSLLSDPADPVCLDRADAAGGEHHPRHRPVPPETLRLHRRPGQVAGGQRHQERCHCLRLISTL